MSVLRDLSLMGLVVALLVACATRSASAQIASPVIAGTPVHCFDPTGLQVFTVFDARINDVAMSSILPNGLRVIIINGPLFQKQPPIIQLFIYAHECGHHISGDIISGVIFHEDNLNREKNADRIGIRLMRDQLHISNQMAGEVASTFENNPPMFPFYLPGPERAQWIRDCYATHNDNCTSHGNGQVRQETEATTGSDRATAAPVPSAMAHHPVENFAKDYSTDTSYDASDLVDAKSGALTDRVFGIEVNKLVSAAKDNFSYVRLNDPNLVDISLSIDWNRHYRNCDLQDTSPMSCLFTLQRDEDGSELVVVYDHVKQALRKILEGWDMHEEKSVLRPGQSTGTLNSSIFQKDGQKVILNIYCGTGYYLNLGFYAPTN